MQRGHLPDMDMLVGDDGTDAVLRDLAAQGSDNNSLEPQVPEPDTRFGDLLTRLDHAPTIAGNHQMTFSSSAAAARYSTTSYAAARPKQPDITAPRHQPAPPISPPPPRQHARPSSSNPFYHKDLDLGMAAQHIHTILSNALRASLRWRDQPARFLALTNKRNAQTPLLRLCAALQHIAEFLQLGRKGWRFVKWPHEFYRDILELTAQLGQCMNGLAELNDCPGWVRQRSVVVVGDIERRVKRIQDQRWSIEGKVDRGQKEEDVWMEFEQEMVREGQRVGGDVGGGGLGGIVSGGRAEGDDDPRGEGQEDEEGESQGAGWDEEEQKEMEIQLDEQVQSSMQRKFED